MKFSDLKKLFDYSTSFSFQFNKLLIVEDCEGHNYNEEVIRVSTEFMKSDDIPDIFDNLTIAHIRPICAGRLELFVEE